jgi:Tfp pilus assembly protein PilO
MSKSAIGLISFLIVLALGIGLIWPKFQEFQRIKSELEEKTLEFESQQEYFSKLQKIDTELKNYEEGLKKIDSALPPFFSPPESLRFFQQAAAKSGLVLKTVKLIPESRRLNLLLLGSYPALKDFLSEIERSSKMIEVENISFSVASEKEPISFQITVKIGVWQ